MFMPYVTGRWRKDWEAYSVEHQGWITQSRALYNERTSTWVEAAGQTMSTTSDAKDDTTRRVLLENDTGNEKNDVAAAATTANLNYISPHIFSKAEDLSGGTEGDLAYADDSSTPRLFYAPVWQVSPPPKQGQEFNKEDGVANNIINYNILGDSLSARLSNAIDVSGGR